MGVVGVVCRGVLFIERIVQTDSFWGTRSGSLVFIQLCRANIGCVHELVVDSIICEG